MNDLNKKLQLVSEVATCMWNCFFDNFTALKVLCISPECYMLDQGKLPSYKYINTYSAEIMSSFLDGSINLDYLFMNNLRNPIICSAVLKARLPLKPEFT